MILFEALLNSWYLSCSSNFPSGYIFMYNNVIYPEKKTQDFCYVSINLIPNMKPKSHKNEWKKVNNYDKIEDGHKKSEIAGNLLLHN